MAGQNYQNHARYYVPHHFVFYPIVIAGIILSCCFMFSHGPTGRWHGHLHWIWVAITALFILAGWLGFMLRQHYSLMNQDRIVRLEMRLRYFILTQQRLEPIEQQLSFGQIAALRFASDEELPALVQKTLQEKLSPKDIKQAIRVWVPDHMRV